MINNLSKAAIIRFCVLRTTVLKHGFETQFYRRAFIEFSPERISGSLGLCHCASHSAQLVPWQKVKQGARFSISITLETQVFSVSFR